MSEAVSTLISALLIRLRDPAGTLRGESGTNVRTLAIDLLGRTQQIYNEALRLNLLSVSCTIQPFLVWYDLGQVIGTNNERMTSLSHVIYKQRDLSKVTLDDLRSIDRKWHRAIGSRLECYVPLGYTHCILWPALSMQDTCTLYGPLLTPMIQDEQTDTLTISEERTPLLLQLTELLLAHRANDELAFSVLLKNFADYLPKENKTTLTQEPTHATEITY
jgi:hypothetical protein